MKDQGVADHQIERRAIAGLKHALKREASATKTLMRYCASSGRTGSLQLEHLPTFAHDLPRYVARHLRLREHETFSFRHIGLTLGDTLISEAWNWFVPQRLTPSMNHLLETSNLPFGQIIAPTRFSRQVLRNETKGLPREVLLRHDALLRRAADNIPISFVRESYQRPFFLRLFQDHLRR